MEQVVEVTSPTEGVWRRFLLLVPLVVVLAIASYLHIRSCGDTLAMYGHHLFDEQAFRTGQVTLSDPDVVEVTSVAQTSMGSVCVTVHALSEGESGVTFRSLEHTDEAETFSVRVHDGIVVEGGVNFSGWEALYASLLVVCAALVVLFVSILVRLWRVSWYGYTMVACGAGLLFFLFQLLVFTLMFVRQSNLNLYHFLLDVREMVGWFVVASLFLMLPLCLLVSLSNISLIRHEGRRPVNLLGIAGSVAWAAIYLFLLFGYDSAKGALALIRPLVLTGVAYGECLLFSTMLCAWLAARHVPNHGLDYLIVLGCGIRPDGTPSPLLAGRIDRAVSFDEERVAAGDAPATFVPSGGQGPDEPVSEAASMAAYLENVRGVDERRIVAEGRSATTRENMRFSREVIEHHAGREAAELRIGFSTTNYHVFRGYVCAHQAGVAVEGMGSRTTYYFWPNAFLREFVGLLANRWKLILVSYLIIIAFYGSMEYVLNLICGG